MLAMTCKPFCCRAEVLVQCNGNVGDSYYLAAGYLSTFGSGYACLQASFDPLRSAALHAFTGASPGGCTQCSTHAQDRVLRLPEQR